MKRNAIYMYLVIFAGKSYTVHDNNDYNFIMLIIEVPTMYVYCYDFYHFLLLKCLFYIVDYVML